MNGGPESSVTLDGASPLELALDRAMDSYWAEERALLAQNHGQRQAATSALAVASSETALATLPPRLYWRGIEVSEEFQRYAARIARGEQLAPWRGQVLARPCPEFRWMEAAAVPRRHGSPLLGRSAKISAMLLSAGTALLAAIGVGSGTASPVKDELDDVVPEHGGSTSSPAPLEEEPLGHLGAERDTTSTPAVGNGKPSTRRQRGLARRGTPARAVMTLAPVASVDAPPDGTGALAGAAADEPSTATMTPEQWLEQAMSEAALADAAPTDRPTSDVSSSDVSATDVSATDVSATVASAPALTAPAGPAPAPARRSATRPAPASRVGVPSDWDPTGKMSILFSDDLPF
jgi:hypothetical protein